VNVKNIEVVRRAHRQIIDTLRDDFGKYASGATLTRLQRIFDYIPTGGRRMFARHSICSFRRVSLRRSFIPVVPELRSMVYAMKKS
jgi:hypothetical protein